MFNVTSADGTRIAFDRSGDGPAIIFTGGAFNDRSTLAPLAALLAPQFTVISYDRRGRGDSGDTFPYAVQREIDDLDALITDAGGSAGVFGFSSGAILALLAAARGSAITKVAAYEPPYAIEGDTRPQPPADLPDQLTALISAGRRGDAVALFQTYIGLPAEVIAQLRNSPMWPALEGFAQSLVYEATITGDPLSVTELAAVPTPTLVLDGAETWPHLQMAARATAAAVPNARHHTLPGSPNHTIDPALAAPVLQELFTDPK